MLKLHGISSLRSSTTFRKAMKQQLYSWLFGPEGAKCKHYGVEFVGPAWSGWNGAGVLHPVTERTGTEMLYNSFLGGGQ
jgi:hypothetical protein